MCNMSQQLNDSLKLSRQIMAVINEDKSRFDNDDIYFLNSKINFLTCEMFFRTIRKTHWRGRKE